MQSQVPAAIDALTATRATPAAAAARRRVGFDDALGGEVALLVAGTGPAMPPVAPPGTGGASPASGQVVPPGGNILPMPYCMLGDPLVQPPLQKSPVGEPVGRPVDPPADTTATMPTPGLDLDALVNSARAGTGTAPSAEPETPALPANSTTPAAAAPPVAASAAQVANPAVPAAPVTLVAAAPPVAADVARADGRRTTSGGDADRATRRPGTAAGASDAIAAAGGDDGQRATPPDARMATDGVAVVKGGAAFESSGHRGGDADAGRGDPSASGTVAGTSAPFAVATERTAGSTTAPGTGASEVVEQRLDAETGTPRWQRELGQRLVESTTHGMRELRLQLQPEHLGPLEVRLRMHDSQVGVWFGSGSAEVRDALQSALPRLREMFAEGGLTMGGASVGQQSAGAHDQAPVIRASVREERAAASLGQAVGSLRAVSTASSRLIDAYA